MASAADAEVLGEESWREVIIEHPPEAVVKTSMNVVVAGLCLMLATLILVLFLWASQGEKKGKPDAFGKYVTVREVAEKYKASWTPGQFWPNSKKHSYKTDKGSPLFKVIWTFLVAWYFISGFFLVVVGILPEIEIFREEKHLRSAAFASAALCLCAVWPMLFRIGSHAKGHVKVGTAPLPATGDDMVIQGTDGVKLLSRKEPMSMVKQAFLWISFATLALAAMFAYLASATLQAWTLPGPQYGTLLFLGPGYGLFTGWLTFASALNLTVAISYASYPAGTLPKPDGDTRYTHRGSWWPILVALQLLLLSVLAKDPAIPVPALVAIFFFTPREMTHLIASLVCACAVGLSTWLVLQERDE